MLTRAMKASFHRCDTGGKYFRYFGMAAAFLHEGQQRPVLRTQLRERVPEGIEFFRIYCAGRFGDIFVLIPKRQENAPQLLPAELIDARVARQPEKPRFELRRGLQAIQGPDHLDEHLLRQVFDVIAASGHGVNKSRDPVLVSDNELPLGVFIALLGSPHEVGQRSR